MNVERRIKHYSSNDKILLVGEGNFSFAKSLANAFGSAVNITATSLDSQGVLVMAYTGIMDTLTQLEELGCTIIHQVSARTMKNHPTLRFKRFDKIVFNFPHADFNLPESDSDMIGLHKKLVRRFFRNAREMLTRKGEVHVTIKTTYPQCEWNIEELGSENGLRLVEECRFNRWEYRGYINKRGSGPKANKTFPVGSASTYIFVSE